MKALNKFELERKIGFPLDTLFFKGQAYDAGDSIVPKICAVTGLTIRYVFTVKTRVNERTRIEIGVAALPMLRQWAPKLYQDLKVGEAALMLYTRSTNEDTSRVTFQTARKDTKSTYTALVRRAKAAVSTYRAETKDAWLPKPLFDLDRTVKMVMPKYTRESYIARWYALRVTELQAALLLLEDPSMAPAPVVTSAPVVKLFAAAGRGKKAVVPSPTTV